jgi:hypothetical protein
VRCLDTLHSIIEKVKAYCGIEKKESLVEIGEDELKEL